MRGHWREMKLKLKRSEYCTKEHIELLDERDKVKCSTKSIGRKRGER